MALKYNHTYRSRSIYLDLFKLEFLVVFGGRARRRTASAPRVRRPKFDLLRGIIDPCLLHHFFVSTNIDTPEQESIYLNSLKLEF
jgi:hypothetical protein